MDLWSWIEMSFAVVFAVLSAAWAVRQFWNYVADEEAKEAHRRALQCKHGVGKLSGIKCKECAKEFEAEVLAERKSSRFEGVMAEALKAIRPEPDVARMRLAREHMDRLINPPQVKDPKFVPGPVEWNPEEDPELDDDEAVLYPGMNHGARQVRFALQRIDYGLQTVETPQPHGLATVYREVFRVFVFRKGDQPKILEEWSQVDEHLAKYMVQGQSVAQVRMQYGKIALKRLTEKLFAEYAGMV